MSNKSARNKLNGHGRVICEKCGKVIITCKCLKCGENILYDICDDCEGLSKLGFYNINCKNHGGY